MKMKHVIMAALAAGTMAAAEVRAANEQIVFINMEKVFSDYYKTKVADTQLKAQAEEFNDERKKLVAVRAELEKKFNQLRDEAGNKGLSDEVRAEKLSKAEEAMLELKNEEEKIRNFDDLRKKQLEDQGRRMKRAIVGEIRDAIRSHAQAKGYTAVLDSSGQTLNGLEAVLYIEPKLDITSEIVTQLNRSAPAAASGEARP